MERTRFIVVGMQRSGTTVTHVGIKDHPNVTMSNDEVWASPFFTKGLSTFTGGKESYKQRRSSYLGLFDLLAASRVSDKTTAYGIKSAIGNRQEAIDFCNCVREYFPGVRIILVSREDLVSQHASLLRAEKTGEWHAWEGQKRSAAGTFAIPPEAFTAYATECRHTNAQLRTLKRTHPVMELVYERDIAPGVQYDKVFEFLGVPVVKVDWLKMTKVAPPAETFVENFKDLQTLMATLPQPTEQEELAAATVVRRERAKGETPNFLMSRACEAFDRGDLDDAWADVETGIAVAAGRPLDVSVRARVCGLAERAASKAGAPVRSDLLGQLEQDVADNAFFVLPRAEVRARGDFAVRACDDALGVLAKGATLDARTRKWAFDVLELALDKRNEPAYAVATMESLKAAHGDSGNFLLLNALVFARMGRSQDAIASMQAAADRDPGLARAKELLAKWRGGK